MINFNTYIESHMILKSKVVVLTGAGISAESGLKTFRDSDGLWENYKISEVATIEAWHENPELVLAFYDARRKQILNTVPNLAHFALVQLEKFYDVTIITQNIDDLHERAGSTDILHLHGEIRYARGEFSEEPIFLTKDTIKLGDKSPENQQLRPHIVWFGEAVPLMDKVTEIVRQCDILIIVGTSLNVYPAAGLVHESKPAIKKYIVDPNEIIRADNSFIHLKGTATEHLPLLIDLLINEALTHKKKG